MIPGVRTSLLIESDVSWRRLSILRAVEMVTWMGGMSEVEAFSPEPSASSVVCMST